MKQSDANKDSTIYEKISNFCTKSPKNQGTNCIIFLVFVICLPAFFRIIEKNMAPSKYPDAPIAFGFISGIIFFIFAAFFCNLVAFIYKFIAIKTSKNEQIEYLFYPFLDRGILMWMVVGSAIGYYILPFFLISDMDHVFLVTKNNLPVFIGVAVFFIFFAFYYQYNIVALTNKRIIYHYPFLKQREIFLDSINRIQQLQRGAFFIEAHNGYRITFTSASKAKNKELINKLTMAINKEG